MEENYNQEQKRKQWEEFQNTNSNKVNLRKERLAMGLWRLSSFVYINNNRYVCLYC